MICGQRLLRSGIIWVRSKSGTLLHDFRLTILFREQAIVNNMKSRREHGEKKTADYLKKDSRIDVQDRATMQKKKKFLTSDNKVDKPNETETVSTREFTWEAHNTVELFDLPILRCHKLEERVRYARTFVPNDLQDAAAIARVTRTNSLTWRQRQNSQGRV